MKQLIVPKAPKILSGQKGLAALLKYLIEVKVVKNFGPDGKIPEMDEKGKKTSKLFLSIQAKFMSKA